MIRYARYFSLVLVPSAGVFTLGFLFGSVVQPAQAHPESECPVCVCECPVALEAAVIEDAWPMEDAWPNWVEEASMELPPPAQSQGPVRSPAPKSDTTKQAVKKALDAIEKVEAAEEVQKKK